MRPQPKWPWELVVILGCVLLVVGCSPQTKDKVLRVFFTGVGPTNHPAPQTVTTIADTNAASIIAAPAEPAGYQHKPFLERNCTACHLTAQSQELRAVGSELCLECHNKLIGAARYVHAPVNDGRCDICHLAHESTERFLLNRKAQDLCLDCHAMNQMVNVRAHASMGTTECVKCHDPHRSEQKKLVKAQS